ncbi:MAG: effector binding domain-containing protein [Anaerocolumna sp.]
MDQLDNVSQVLERKMDIRIVYLPPTTVISSHHIGEGPEEVAGTKIYSLIRDINLPVIKPDFRVFGFNNPSPSHEQSVYGYEFWVTVPETIEVEESYEKKYFPGDLYAAHCIKFGDFHEWEAFSNQLSTSEEYEIDYRSPDGMGGCLEEELNVYNNILESVQKTEQLDLLIPIKQRIQ